MNSVLSELRHTILPARESRHGPLPPLLVAMTFVTGLVDAFSYLVLGHVFVANMTGNVVFLGFALAGAPDFSILDSFLALVSFGLGALVGGKLGSQLGHHRGRHLSTAAAVQAVFLAASVALAVLPMADGYRDILIVVLSVAMGLQNATVRKLGVPDMTTTVLTLTITGIAADSTIVGGKGSLAGRRFVSVGAMLAGALIGAALIIHVSVVSPLLIALTLVVMVAATAWLLGTSDAAWVRTTS
jgi:uncharacterized membrane protein YoaK (UPF0700 family)